MKKPDQLETIDPTQLDHVSGGASREASSSSSDAVMTALTGILDSIKSLTSQNQGGLSSTDMMLMMMMMSNRNAPVVAAAPAQPTNWTWDANGGYWIVK
jgi:hypothetical protein